MLKMVISVVRMKIGLTVRDDYIIDIQAFIAESHMLKNGGFCREDEKWSYCERRLHYRYLGFYC